MMLESIDISIEEIRNHPERLANLILANDEHSLMLEKRADMIHITYMKQYHQETRRIVAEARQAYIAQKADGHDREQAFVEFFQAQAEITEQLGDTDRS